MIRTLTGLAMLAVISVSAAAQEAAQEAEREPFETWAADFEARLLERGVEEAIVESMLDGLEPDMRIVERDSSQPEFVRPVWVYLAGAASDARVNNGLAAQAEHAAALAVVTDAFDVDPDILTAIWGLESAYGVIQGDFDLVRSLATLAWEGRRRSFAEAQLFAAAEMIERGYARRDELKGSWAGAMGQTQFIPTTYLERAVDMTGDGRRDIWEEEADALGSAANLLTQAGWDGDAPVVFEVTLPDDFDYAAWSPTRRRAASAWALDGVRLADGEWAADDLYRSGRILIPAGASGPAFMVFSNFDALLRYNNSTAYALGVAYLAKRLDGLEALPDGWPEDDVPLTRTQARELQQALTDLGYDTGGVDGMIGPNSRAALRDFQRASGVTPDGYVGSRMYEAVMAASAG